MTNLCVKNFSCIANANLDIGRLTAIIGPQASGKSVLSKLAYQMRGHLISPYRSFDELETLNEFADHIDLEFRKWFPMEAWGDKQFSISFTAGEYSISIDRKRRYGVASSEFYVQFNDKFEADYEAVSSLLQGSNADKLAKLGQDTAGYWRLMSALEEQALELMAAGFGEDWIESQRFVPAGRSFFTSMGKVVTIFESLDPVTTEFGKIYIPYKDRRNVLSRRRPLPTATASAFRELLGGELKTEKDREFLETGDGRRIPLVAMSSGQQEILPLIIMLEQSVYSVSKSSALFIEEPEAHLFPQSQADLTDLIVATMNAQPGLSRSTFITTHSPYVLGQLNNLIKAGQLASTSRALASAVNKIVPAASQIRGNDVRAYEIKDGETASIIDDEGLIDSDYLDSVSQEISQQYMALVEVEFSRV